MLDIFLDGQGADAGLMLYADNNNFVRFELHFYAGSPVSHLAISFVYSIVSYFVLLFYLYYFI